MKSLWIALVCGGLWAFGGCGDTSSRLTCGSETVEIEGTCLPGGEGGEGTALGGRSGTGLPSGGRAGATSNPQGGDSAAGAPGGAGGGAGDKGAGAPNGVAGGGADGDGHEHAGASNGGGSGAGGSSVGDATGGAAGEAAGGAGDVCTTGPIECAPGVALADSGSFTASGSSDLIALDDATALVGNHVTNELNIFDMCSGTVKKSWPLPAQPGDIAFDATSRTAYVVLRDQPAIARVMLDAGVTLIDLPKPALMLTTGNRGRVFARLNDTSALLGAGISIIDGRRAVVLATVYADFRGLITYEHKTNRLITGSDGGLNAFKFVEATSELILDEYSNSVGGANCRQLTISPDQRRIVLTCGGGSMVTNSTPPYQIVDVDPAHLQVLYGLYDVGYYPGPAAFSPRSTYFYAVGEGAVLVFEVATHARVSSYPMRAEQLSVSPSGRVLLGRSGSANISTLSWVRLREASDCR